jgi:3-isopropylmalate/(R)-2-methylmalate dehydratase large subunit
MGMTMAEKILARTSKRDKVSPNEFVTAKLDLVMGHDLSFWAAYKAMTNSGFDQVWDPEKIVVIIDHLVPAMNVRAARAHQQIREWVKKQNIRNFYDCGVGICHQVIPEEGHALPGGLIVGGDSHTTTYGALGAASCGIGISELAWSMAKGSLWFMVPETIRFNLTGKLAPGVSAKDIILKIAGDYTAEVAQYKAVEFSGPAANALSMDGRMTISNMGVEIGAKFTFFESDEKTIAFLKERSIEKVGVFGPDQDAAYENISNCLPSQCG